MTGSPFDDVDLGTDRNEILNALCERLSEGRARDDFSLATGCPRCENYEGRCVRAWSDGRKFVREDSGLLEGSRDERFFDESGAAAVVVEEGVRIDGGEETQTEEQAHGDEERHIDGPASTGP